MPSFPLAPAQSVDGTVACAAAAMTALRVAFFFLLAAAALPLHAADALSRSLVLVAKPELRDPLYGRTVLVVRSFGARQHVGFIVNRPSSVTLGSMFPQDAASQKVADPVYVGGPVDLRRLFALVAGDESPGPGSIAMMPGLEALRKSQVETLVIADDPEHASFVAGVVVWRPGELQSELDRGLWYVLEPDAALVLRDSTGLWRELVHRAERELHMIRARN